MILAEADLNKINLTIKVTVWFSNHQSSPPSSKRLIIFSERASKIRHAHWLGNLLIKKYTQVLPSRNDCIMLPISSVYMTLHSRKRPLLISRLLVCNTGFLLWCVASEPKALMTSSRPIFSHFRKLSPEPQCILHNCFHHVHSAHPD